MKKETKKLRCLKVKRKKLGREKVEEKGVEWEEREVRKGKREERKGKRGGERRKELQIPPTFPVCSV